MLALPLLRSELLCSELLWSDLLCSELLWSDLLWSDGPLPCPASAGATPEKTSVIVITVVAASPASGRARPPFHARVMVYLLPPGPREPVSKPWASLTPP